MLEGRGEQHILLDKSDRVATITLNRPERLNAFGGLMRQELFEILEALKVDAEIRVVVISALLEKRDPHFEGR